MLGKLIFNHIDQKFWLHFYRLISKRNRPIRQKKGVSFIAKQDKYASTIGSRYMYRGSPTSTVSSSTISTSTVFECYVLKTVLVEFLCTINRTSGNWLCSTHQYEFRIVRFFQNPKNRTKRGPPAISANTHYKMLLQILCLCS